MRPLPLWAGRVVLGLAGLLLLRVGLGLIADPVHAVTEQDIALPSPSAVTSMRAVGGAFLAVGLLLLGSLFAAGWIRSGLVLLLTFAGAIATGRLLGLALDGPAPFTLKVLKPEMVSFFSPPWRWSPPSGVRGSPPAGRRVARMGGVEHGSGRMGSDE